MYEFLAEKIKIFRCKNEVFNDVVMKHIFEREEMGVYTVYGNTYIFCCCSRIISETSGVLTRSGKIFLEIYL